MYVRDAKNRDEAWLLDRIESMGLDDVAFRSRDYVIAVDERTNERAGFGRLRIHRTDDGELCELTGIGVLGAWRGQGVGAHVVERLVEEAGDAGFETVHSLTDQPGYLSQFGFRPVETDRLPPVLRDRLSEVRAAEAETEEAVGTRLAVDRFRMPDRLREAFKTASPREAGESGGDETAEDFGIDPDEATYKYDTGR
jgi:N-acetylglutamate synthase-like GNAT family acetyltransferase